MLGLLFAPPFVRFLISPLLPSQLLLTLTTRMASTSVPAVSSFATRTLGTAFARPLPCTIFTRRCYLLSWHLRSCCSRESAKGSIACLVGVRHEVQGVVEPAGIFSELNLELHVCNGLMQEEGLKTLASQLLPNLTLCSESPLRLRSLLSLIGRSLLTAKMHESAQGP